MHTDSRINVALAEAADRMADTTCYLFSTYLADPSAIVRRELYYTGGPVCLAAYTNGQRRATVQESVWNSRPAHVCPNAPAFVISQ